MDDKVRAASEIHANYVDIQSKLFYQVLILLVTAILLT
jgi:hypothetical protein